MERIRSEIHDTYRCNRYQEEIECCGTGGCGIWNLESDKIYIYSSFVSREFLFGVIKA